LNQHRVGRELARARASRALVAPRHPLLAELDIMESDYLSKMGRARRSGHGEKAMHAHQEATGLPPPVPYGSCIGSGAESRAGAP
jgi:hypothetical protein